MKGWGVEDRHGHGAYGAMWETFGDAGMRRCTGWDRNLPNPLPNQDGMNVFAISVCECLFGFRSPEDLTAWFGTDPRPLNDIGVCVVIYEVPDDAVIVGGHQVAFDPRVATPLAHSTVDDFMREVSV